MPRSGKKSVRDEEAGETEGLAGSFSRSLARSLVSSCLLMSRTSVYRFAVSLSFLSREIMILTYASCRVTVDLNDLTTPPANVPALDTLTAYITVNVADDDDAIDGEREIERRRESGRAERV